MIKDIRQNKNKSTTITAPKDYNHRFCYHCHLHLVYDERSNIFKCPRCNCSTTIQNTAPDTKIRTNFPVFNPSQSHSKEHIVQARDEQLSRSEYFVRKRLQNKKELEDDDPYLQILKNNNQIRITNVEYFSPDDTDYNY